MRFFLDPENPALSPLARETFSGLFDQLEDLETRIAHLTKKIERTAKEHPICRKLTRMPGIGPITAVSLMAILPSIDTFRNGRHLAAWEGSPSGATPNFEPF